MYLFKYFLSMLETTNRWIAIDYTNIHGPQTINSNDFGDHVTSSRLMIVDFE